MGAFAGILPADRFQEWSMKSQFRCILFALIAVPAACGGDRPASPPSKPAVVAVSPAPAPAVIAPVPAVPQPAPAAEAAPVAAAQVPVAPTTFSETMAQGKAAAVSGDQA